MANANTYNVDDIQAILSDASGIAHPTMEDADYGQFLALGGKYTACRNVLGNSQFLDYLATQPKTQENADRVKDTERRLLTSRQLYHLFDSVAQSSDLNVDAQKMVQFYQKASAQIDEMESTPYEELEENAKLMGTDIDELIASEQMHHAKRARQQIDRAERSAKYAVENEAAMIKLLVEPTDNDYVEMTDSELLAYVNKFSLKIGNPPSKSKTADSLGHKFKAYNLMEEAKNRLAKVKGINPLLEKEVAEEFTMAKAAVYGLAKLEEHINTMVRTLTENVEASQRMVINEREGIEMY